MFVPKILTKIDLPKIIETNLSEIDGLISEKCDRAKKLVINTDSLDDCALADKDAAELNKLAGNIKRARIAFDKEWRAPFEGVLGIFKSYEKKLEEAARILKDQSNEGKLKVKYAKKMRLLDKMNELLAETELPDYSYFKNWFEERTDPNAGSWLNFSFKEEKIIAEIQERINECEKALIHYYMMVSSLPDDARIAGVKVMFETYDIDKALEAAREYQEAKTRAGKLMAQKADNCSELKSVAEVQKEEEKPRAFVSDDERVETYTLEITGKRSALFQLRAYGESLGIKFKRAN